MTEERVGKPVPITVLRLSQKLEIAVTPRESPPRAAPEYFDKPEKTPWPGSTRGPSAHGL